MERSLSSGSFLWISVKLTSKKVKCDNVKFITFITVQVLNLSCSLSPSVSQGVLVCKIMTHFRDVLQLLLVTLDFQVECMLANLLRLLTDSLYFTACRLKQRGSVCARSFHSNRPVSHAKQRTPTVRKMKM